MGVSSLFSRVQTSGRQSLIVQAAALLLIFLMSNSNVFAYSVLTHEEIVDVAWLSDIRPLLLHRFPGLTDDQIKEAHAYVGPSRKPLDIKVVIGGKSRTLELGDAVGNACNTLIDKIYPALTTLIASASSDSVVTLLQNIIITGGGSQIRGIDTVLQKRLSDDGFENPKVRLAGQDFQRYVAIGALKAARAARENQWQVLLA